MGIFLRLGLFFRLRRWNRTKKLTNHQTCLTFNYCFCMEASKEHVSYMEQKRIFFNSFIRFASIHPQGLDKKKYRLRNRSSIWTKNEQLVIDLIAARIANCVISLFTIVLNHCVYFFLFYWFHRRIYRGAWRCLRHWAWAQLKGLTRPLFAPFRFIRKEWMNWSKIKDTELYWY